MTLLRIMIGEQEEHVSTPLRDQLRERQYDVEVARDGLVLLDVAMRFRPALVLVSLSLPFLDGWEVARALTRVPLFRSPRLVAMTDRERPVPKSMLERVGFAYALRKPVEIATLQLLLDNDATVGKLARQGSSSC